MDEKTDTIKRYIDAERAELGRNLDEIEYRVKSATDLKAHFDAHTGLALGAAFTGGLLLSLALRKPSNSGTQDWESASRTERIGNTAPRPAHPAAKHLRRFSETIDNIVDGLVGVASDKLQSYVANTVPGFQAHIASDRQRGMSSVHRMKPDLDISTRSD